MVSTEVWIAIIFYLVLGLIIYKYRSKFQVMYKVIFAYKTQRTIKTMHKIAEWTPFWKIFSTIAIPVAVFFMFKIGFLLWENAAQIIEGAAGAGVALAIPGIKIPGSPIFIPLWYGLISLAVLAVVHEFAHGIIAAMEGIRIKSVGFGLALVLPLAFVELDEKQMSRTEPLKRLRIAASGAFANVVFFGLMMLLLIFVVVPFTSSLTDFNGVTVTGLTSGLPAAMAGVPERAVVTGVDDYNITTVSDFVLAVGSIKPGDTINLKTSEGDFVVDTVPDPKNESKPYLGVYLQQNSEPTPEAQEKFGIALPAIFWFEGLFVWIANLNFLIGIMNFLPIWGLDGSRVAYDILKYVIKKDRIIIAILNGLFLFFIGLLLFNIVGPFFV